MFLMSHLSETVRNAEVATQNLLDRTVVHSRLWQIKHALGMLQDTFMAQRVRKVAHAGAPGAVHSFNVPRVHYVALNGYFHQSIITVV